MRRRLPNVIAYTAVSLVKGLIVTFTNLLRKKVTLMYPEERWDLPENYRGIPSLPVDAKTGKTRCIACGACARICPEQVITVEHEVGEDKKRKLVDFTIDLSRCIFCGLCAEICPTDAIKMSDVYELSSVSRDQMIASFEDLKKAGGLFPEEPAENAADQPASNDEDEEKGGQ